MKLRLIRAQFRILNLKQSKFSMWLQQLQKLKQMAERRPWTEQEDRLLKFLFETSGLTKWSHIARKLQEQHGVKGRNGKQCKERFITHIDTTHPKQEWSYSDEQRMFDLHNELGNKWAIIGSKLDGRSDNCVKNHFYSKLRKGLRKVNKVIQAIYKKQIKQFKPNVLYRIVEVSEEKFKPIPSYQKEFSMFSNQLKNDLLEFSYDDEIVENNSGLQEEEESINVEQAKEMIEKINQFGLNYKKKAKKQRRGSAQTQDLLTPERYQQNKRCSTENGDGEVNNSLVYSSETSNLDDLSEDEMNRAITPKRSRKCSEESSNIFLMDRIRTRANSQGNTQDHSSESASSSQMKDEKPEQKLSRQAKELQGALDGLYILQQEDIPPHPLMMKKDTSKYQRYSDVVEPEQFHFFEDSQIQMRILPEMDLGFNRDSQFQENIFN